MPSLNRVTLIGNLGKDPEVRSFQNGGQVCKFSVATSERWKDKSSGETKEKTEWHNICIYNDLLIKFAERLHKGSTVFIEGQLETRKYTDNAGVEKYTTEIVLKQYRGELLDMTPRGAEPAQEQPAPQQRKSAMPQLDDEVPFAILLAIGLSALQMFA